MDLSVDLGLQQLLEVPVAHQHTVFLGSLNAFSVEFLNLLVVVNFLLKSSQAHVDGLEAVGDATPPFPHDLGAFLVGHARELLLDQGCSLALVHSVGTDLLDWALLLYVGEV